MVKFNNHSKSDLWLKIHQLHPEISQLFCRSSARFSWSHRGSNKIVKENQDRGWFRDGPRCLKQVSVKSCLLLPLTKFSKICVFSASDNFKAFFDRYLAVKSYLHVLKFFVGFINVSILVLNLKSVHPERKYFHFSGTRYAETPFP